MYTYQVAIDPKSFVGVQSVADAVEYMHFGKSVGKVCENIQKSIPGTFNINLETLHAYF